MQFSGQFHMVLHFIPGNPVRFYSNAVAIKGTGSQWLYNLIGNGITDQLEINGSELRVRQIFRLIPGNHGVTTHNSTKISTFLADPKREFRSRDLFG